MELFSRLKATSPAIWDDYINHQFVRELGDGTLPQHCFRHYLAQDYLFLIHFARAYALAVFKARELADMRAAYSGLKAILDTEMDLHVRLCARWGICEPDLEQTPEATATLAYTRFVLETGLRGDLLDLNVALAPCILGYSEIGLNLSKRRGALAADNAYREWIAEYSGDAYQTVASQAGGFLDRLSVGIGERRFAELATVFEQATRLEIDFWAMGLNQST